jgi:hypothetical protein
MAHLYAARSAPVRSKSSVLIASTGSSPSYPDGEAYSKRLLEHSSRTTAPRLYYLQMKICRVCSATPEASRLTLRVTTGKWTGALLRTANTVRYLTKSIPMIQPNQMCSYCRSRCEHTRVQDRQRCAERLAKEWSNGLKQAFIGYIGCSESKFLAWKNATAQETVAKVETV